MKNFGNSLIIDWDAWDDARYVEFSSPRSDETKFSSSLSLEDPGNNYDDLFPSNLFEGE